MIEIMDKILFGDCLSILKQMPDNQIDCVITSPPYWGLRDYGAEGQIGLEKTPDEYIEKMVEIFRQIRRVLKPSGTCWLNLGDTYIGGKRGFSASGRLYISAKQATNAGSIIPPMEIPDGMKSKDLCGIPWRVAVALQADGWWLRQDIIWHKPNPMPEGVKDRCVKSHEYIFLLTKSAKYFFDYQSIQEMAQYDGRKDTTKKSSKKYTVKYMPDKYGFKSPHNRQRERWPSRGRNGILMRNRRSVWTVPTQPFPEAHFATFPEKLVEPCLLAGCPEGGIVLDPFIGSGTTAVVACRYGRHYLGIEVNSEYVKIAERRISKEKGNFALFEKK